MEPLDGATHSLKPHQVSRDEGVTPWGDSHGAYSQPSVVYQRASASSSTTSIPCTTSATDSKRKDNLLLPVVELAKQLASVDVGLLSGKQIQEFLALKNECAFILSEAINAETEQIKRCHPQHNDMRMMTYVVPDDVSPLVLDRGVPPQTWSSCAARAPPFQYEPKRKEFSFRNRDSGPYPLAEAQSSETFRTAMPSMQVHTTSSLISNPFSASASAYSPDLLSSGKDEQYHDAATPTAVVYAPSSPSVRFTTKGSRRDVPLRTEKSRSLPANEKIRKPKVSMSGSAGSPSQNNVPNFPCQCTVVKGFCGAECSKREGTKSVRVELWACDQHQRRLLLSSDLPTRNVSSTGLLDICVEQLKDARDSVSRTFMIRLVPRSRAHDSDHGMDGDMKDSNIQLTDSKGHALPGNTLSLKNDERKAHIFVRGLELQEWGSSSGALRSPVNLSFQLKWRLSR